MRDKRFILTRELGKLAKWLRILGCDTVYYRDRETAGLVITALREDRRIVTRTSGLKKFTGINITVIEHDHVEDQLDQLVGELGLVFSPEDLFKRCVRCNERLRPVKKDVIKEKIPRYVYNTQEEFTECPSCEKVFWKGTHWDLVGAWLEKRGIQTDGAGKEEKGRESGHIKQ